MIFDHVVYPAPRYLMRLAVVEEVFDCLTQPPGRFLEVGAGSGDVSAYALSRYPAATGCILDFSDGAVAALSERFSGDGRVEVSSMDMFQLPEDRRFDLLMAFEVLEHIQNDAAALQKMGSLTNEGGFLLLSVPAFSRKWQAVDEYAGHFRRYERAELRSKLSDAGFALEACFCYGFPITHLTYPLREFHYRRAMRRSSSTHSMEELTKTSGIERPYSPVLRTLRLDFLLRPFFVLQRLFYRSSVGDGFVVLARRRSGF